MQYQHFASARSFIPACAFLLSTVDSTSQRPQLQSGILHLEAHVEKTKKKPFREYIVYIDVGCNLCDCCPVCLSVFYASFLYVMWLWSMKRVAAVYVWRRSSGEDTHPTGTPQEIFSPRDRLQRKEDDGASSAPASAAICVAGPESSKLSCHNSFRLE